MSRIKVLAVAQDLDPSHLGGAESHHVEVVKRLADSGKFEFDIFVGPNAAIKKIWTNKHVRVHTVTYPKITNLCSFSYLIAANPRIIVFALTHPVDLIFAKEVFPLGIICAAVKLLIRKPLYITAQNPNNFSEEMILQGPLAPLFRFFAFPVIRLLISFAARLSDLTAGISRYSAFQAAKFGAKHTTVIPNGVDPSLFPPHKKQRGKPFQILSTSSFIPRNGLDVLVEAFALLPQGQFHLTLTSAGPLLESIKNLATQFKVFSNITFLGKVDPDQIPVLLSQADVFVRPSRAEGLGTSFIEAMAAGLPIIGTPVGGIPDFLTHRQTGLMSKVDDPQSVARNILLLKHDPKLYSSIRLNSLALIKRTYTWAKISKAVEREFIKLTK